MNYSEGREQVERDTVNVVSLFGNQAAAAAEIIINDPLETLLKEALIEDSIAPSEIRVRKVVTENQFPDQAMFTLEEQLSNLRSSLNRIKYYIGDIDDLLPR